MAKLATLSAKLRARGMSRIWKGYSPPVCLPRRIGCPDLTHQPRGRSDTASASLRTATSILTRTRSNGRSLPLEPRVPQSVEDQGLRVQVGAGNIILNKRSLSTLLRRHPTLSLRDALGETGGSMVRAAHGRIKVKLGSRGARAPLTCVNGGPMEARRKAGCSQVLAYRCYCTCGLKRSATEPRTWKHLASYSKNSHCHESRSSEQY